MPKSITPVSRSFPNSITTTQQTCCQLVADLLATRRIFWLVKIVCRVANKSATSWQLPRLWGSYGQTCVMDFGHYCVYSLLLALTDRIGCRLRIGLRTRALLRLHYRQECRWVHTTHARLGRHQCCFCGRERKYHSTFNTWWPHPTSSLPKILPCSLGVGGWPLGCEERMCCACVQLASKISNFYDSDPPTLQTDGETDGRTDMQSQYRAMYYVHRAVKT